MQRDSLHFCARTAYASCALYGLSRVPSLGDPLRGLLSGDEGLYIAITIPHDPAFVNLNAADPCLNPWLPTTGQDEHRPAVDPDPAGAADPQLDRRP
jgi:hypothetical protein